MSRAQLGEHRFFGFSGSVPSTPRAVCLVRPAAPRPVRVVAVEARPVLAGVGDVIGHARQPLQRIHGLEVSERDPRRRDGRELFYLARDKRLMSVPVTGADALRFGMPTALFRNDALVWAEGTGDNYDVSADGQRFVVILVPPNTPPPAIHVILNWTAGLPK